MKKLFKSKKFLLIGLIVVSIVGLVVVLNPTEAAPPQATTLSGTINANGGGAWVMAMDESLPTRPRTIVVSNNQQKYEIPDLDPNKTYTVLGRAYGCEDKWIHDVSPGISLSS